MPFNPRLKPKRSKVSVNYHGRTGTPMIHFSQPVTRPRMQHARAYIMVRKEGGGTERLHLDLKRAAEISGITKLREEARRIKMQQIQGFTIDARRKAMIRAERTGRAQVMPSLSLFPKRRRR